MDLDVRMKAVCLAACFLIGKNLFIKNEEESYFHTEKCRKYHAVYEPITDMYRYRPIYRLSADNWFCRYGISLSVSVIGIGRYEWPYR